MGSYILLLKTLIISEDNKIMGKKEYNLDNSELTFRVFDTLFKTKDQNHFDTSEINNRSIAPRKGQISFDYRGKRVLLLVLSEDIE